MQWEVVGLKKKHEVLPALAERLELPQDAVSGAVRLTAVGKGLR